MSTHRRPPMWAELPLVLVHVTVVAGFARLYDDTSFFWPLVGFVLIAHALAIATRRRRVWVPATAVIAVAGAGLGATWLLFGATTRWGLPTSETWAAASSALQEAQDRYPVVVAPTAALVGFQLASGLALWAAVWFADWTAHRLKATAEAVAPAAAIFVFCSIVGSGQHQIASAAAFIAATLLFVAVQRAVLSGSPSLPALRGAAAVAAVAVLGAALVAPRLPGADAEAAIRWRNGGRGDSSRVTVSPMVQLKKRIVNQSDTIAFEVRSTKQSYWRLTALDAFDGEIWSSSGEFRPAGDDLPTNIPLPATERSDRITQRFTIEALSAIWAPSAYEARSVRDSDAKLRWDPESSTLIVESSKATTDGMSYTVVSQSPTIDPTDLARATNTDPVDLAATYEDLPTDFPRLASATARQVTAGATSRYERVLALQDWFRSEFTYSTAVDAAHSDDALVSFLRSRRGYCEQFAGAFAAMARSLGMPARVAVGFTPGNASATTPNTYVVRGRHAHAWPEVYFPSIGWVPFEPTPGRGIPGASNYTGVPAMQDETPAPTDDGTTTDVPTTTSANSADTEPQTAATDPAVGAARTVDAPPDDRDADQRSSPWPLVVALSGLAAAVAVVVVRRRRTAAPAALISRPDRAWDQAAAALRRNLELEIAPSDTPVEVATRAQPHTESQRGALLELADLVTESRWSDQPTDAATDERALALAAAIDAGLAEDYERSMSSSASSSSRRSRSRMRSPVSPK